MKTFKINTLNEASANVLENYLKEHLKNNSFDISSKKDENLFLVNISFVDSKINCDNFIYYFSNFIIDNYEKKIFNLIIEDEYFYFNKNDINYIYNIYIELKSISFENDCLSCIEKNFKFYLKNGDFLDLLGFIHFGIKNYSKKIKEKVDESVNSFVVEREYEKFLEMLKSYIETSPSKIYKIHLVYLNSNATLLDDDGNEIKLENISSNVILSDFDFSKNDYVLNTLISLAPKEIVLHLLSPCDNFINAIKEIFTNRVIISN